MLRSLNSSFIRFVIVGVFNTVVGLGTSFLLFNLLELGYWVSTFTGNTIGAIVSYFLNKSFTFRSDVSVRSSWWKFALVILICYGLSYGASMLLANLCSYLFPSASPALLHNGAILIGNGLYMISNYLGHRYFTFRASSVQNVRKR
jgi:putative flippase GtrA